MQAAALVAIPVLNYTLNSRWTFQGHRAGRHRGAYEDAIAEDSSGASSRL